MLADAMFRNANRGILVVGPLTHIAPYSLSADKLFMPASNQKILTASAALAQLGVDYRFTTQFYATAPIVDGVLRGDLMWPGRGDPSMSDAIMGDALAPLRAAADSLYLLGLREISGVLTKGGNAFPDMTIGSWDWDNLETTSGAALDELLLNQALRA